MKTLHIALFALMITLAGCSQQTKPEPKAAAHDKPTGPVVYSSAETFSADVIKADGLVVVDFYADWCGPCRQVAPILKELADEYEGKVKIVKIDIDENQELAEEFGVRSIPSFFTFKDGKVLEGKVGAMSKKDFSSWFDSALQPGA